VSPQAWRTEFKVLDQVSRPGGVLSTRAAFVVENGAGRLTAA
jgi:alkaline phosphatase D